MTDRLTAIRAALACLSERELHAIGAATYADPPVAPGLLAWIEMITDWELHRRRGIDFPLRDPEEVIDPIVDADSIVVALALRDVFARDGANVVTFFGAVADVLTGDTQRH